MTSFRPPSITSVAYLDPRRMHYGPGATAYLFRFATGHTVVVLSNYDTAAQIVREYIRERTGN